VLDRPSVADLFEVRMDVLVRLASNTPQDSVKEVRSTWNLGSPRPLPSSREPDGLRTP